MPFNVDTLAANLRAFRARDRLTQEEVASKVGITPSSVVNYESGKSAPSYEIAWRLADLYCVTLGELGGRKEHIDHVA